MYSVMLVDDERLIVNGLESIIDWDNLDLKIIHRAYDGYDALEKFKETNVDIVVTDITMPYLDGLKLIEEIKKVSISTKFIILSGYDDFKYAKKAMFLGIENYILKPINEDELENTLKLTVEKINREKKVSVFEKQDIETITDNVYNRWITNRISQYELEEREFILGLSVKYDNYSVALIKFKKHQNINFSNILGSFKERYGSDKVIFFKDLNNNIAVIAGWNDNQWTYTGFEEFLTNIIKDINGKFGLDMFITIGDSQRYSINAYKSYEKAVELQNYLLIYGYNCTINESAILEKSKKTKFMSKVNLDEFSKILMKKDEESLEKYIANVFEHLEKDNGATPNLIQGIAADMLLIIRKTMEELNIVPEEGYGDIREVILSVYKKETLDEVKESIKNESFRILDIINANSIKVSPVIQQILDYIKHNFAEELSLKVLADKYNINTSYLGQLFSKEVGMSFSEYLNKVKNEEAKKLLLNTNMRINEIAKSIGYLDTSYFYKKFKKYYGVCPNTLRSSKNYQS